MTQHIKLMADYGTSPLWRTDPSDPDNIEPAALPLSDETRARLAQWAAAYDATLDLDDPATAGFPSVGAEESWEREGIELWKQVRSELGPAYDVSYYSWTAHELLTNPDDLSPG